MVTNPTLQETLRQAALSGMERIDAQLLMLHVLRTHGQPAHDRAWLISHDTQCLTANEQILFQDLCQRRCAGEPVAYLTGSKEFFGLDFAVDPRVLIPRPDTETLVEWALALDIARDAAAKVLDLGTGSGAIAIALKHQRPHWQLTAVDASLEALEVARTNATSHRLKIHFLQSHWLDAVNGAFHLIISNPPYIAEADPHLADLRYEPQQALAAGRDGLADLHCIISQAGKHLHPNGWLLLEHGHDQAEATRALLTQHGFSNVQSHKDLAGIERCSGGQWFGYHLGS